MSDEEWQAFRADLEKLCGVYNRANDTKSVNPGGIPTRLFAAEDIMSQALPALLAEVERLRADVLWKRVPYQGGWLPVTYRDELHRREQRINALQAENAAMCEIVQAVAELESTTFPGGWNGYDYDDVNEIVTKARALQVTDDEDKDDDEGDTATHTESGS